MYKVFFTNKSSKELSKLSRVHAKTILSKIKQLTYPFPANFDIKSMQGVAGFFRLRVGTMRVIVELDTKRKEIWIRKVGYRQDVYKNYKR